MIGKEQYILKTLHLSIIIAVLTSGIVLVAIITILQEHPPIVLSRKSPVLPQDIRIDYYTNMTSKILLKPFQIQTIPVQIYAPQDKPLDVKLTVTGVDFFRTRNANIPFGVWATLNKNEINLPAISEKDTIVRDTVQLTVFTYLPTSGTYKIAALLYKDNGEGSSRIITIKVD